MGEVPDCSQPPARRGANDAVESSQEGGPTSLHAVVPEQIFVAQGLPGAEGDLDFRIFKPNKNIRYHAVCDDFGPMNISSVIEFVEQMEAEIAAFPSSKILYHVEPGKRVLANAAFLLGAYLILKLDYTSQKVSQVFKWLDSSMVEHFRDATHSRSNFDLTLLDCWRGFERGKANGWIDLPCIFPHVWGKINVDEYRQFEDPINADLHEVVPCKLVAFRGPKDLGGGHLYLDDARGYRHFSASHYVDVFHSIGVTTVIRLNASEYDPTAFTSRGIAHHDLRFDDCTAPHARIVETFFRLVDGAPGAVAVHCKAGLGRTGTMIALYLMRTYGFAAGEAIAWLRIMRPGSVLGQQQQYLCDVERGVQAVARRLRHTHAHVQNAPAHTSVSPATATAVLAGSQSTRAHTAPAFPAIAAATNAAAGASPSSVLRTPSSGSSAGGGGGGGGSGRAGKPSNTCGAGAAAGGAGAGRGADQAPAAACAGGGNYPAGSRRTSCESVASLPPPPPSTPASPRHVTSAQAAVRPTADEGLRERGRAAAEPAAAAAAALGEQAAAGAARRHAGWLSPPAARTRTPPVVVPPQPQSHRRVPEPVLPPII